MKKICESDNISIFDNTKTVMDADNILSVTNVYWGPNEMIIKMIEQLCITNKYEKVLEIGPGTIPFKLATDFIGSNETIQNYIDIDIDKEKLYMMIIVLILFIVVMF